MAFGSSCSIRNRVECNGARLDYGYRVDLLVQDKLIIELKSVEQIKGTRSQEHPRAAVADLHGDGGSEDRFLINFNVTKLKSGIKRFVL